IGLMGGGDLEDASEESGFNFMLDRAAAEHTPQQADLEPDTEQMQQDLDDLITSLPTESPVAGLAGSEAMMNAEDADAAQVEPVGEEVHQAASSFPPSWDDIGLLDDDLEDQSDESGFTFMLDRPADQQTAQSEGMIPASENLEQDLEKLIDQLPMEATVPTAKESDASDSEPTWSQANDNALHEEDVVDHLAAEAQQEAPGETEQPPVPDEAMAAASVEPTPVDPGEPSSTQAPETEETEEVQTPEPPVVEPAATVAQEQTEAPDVPLETPPVAASPEVPTFEQMPATTKPEVPIAAAAESTQADASDTSGSSYLSTEALTEQIQKMLENAQQQQAEMARKMSESPEPATTEDLYEPTAAEHRFEPAVAEEWTEPIEPSETVEAESEAEPVSALEDIAVAEGMDEAKTEADSLLSQVGSGSGLLDMGVDSVSPTEAAFMPVSEETASVISSVEESSAEPEPEPETSVPSAEEIRSLERELEVMLGPTDSSAALAASESTGPGEGHRAGRIDTDAAVALAPTAPVEQAATERKKPETREPFSSRLEAVGWTAIRLVKAMGVVTVGLFEYLNNFMPRSQQARDMVGYAGVQMIVLSVCIMVGAVRGLELAMVTLAALAVPSALLFVYLFGRPNQSNGSSGASGTA
ncbi:MAG: hypothetical protein R3236_01615, partial [Phycisphaeraceae bacterium]|nr:hypothetical protein [Phycisphaeraceae bacterium]